MKSGVLDFVPLQFAVFRISSFLSWRGLTRYQCWTQHRPRQHSHPVPKCIGDRDGQRQAEWRPKLAVRVTYEGRRLSADCLTEAYERLSHEQA
jgi:hypothetical protein